MEYTKPLPQIDNWNRPFWDAAHRHELSVQACADCGHMFTPPGPVCPECLGDKLQWKTVSGRGVVESWVVFHQQYFKGFEKDLPYNVAMIRLDEGPFLFTNILEIDNGDLRRGLQVEVVFEQATEEITIPCFRPINAEVTEHA